MSKVISPATLGAVNPQQQRDNIFEKIATDLLNAPKGRAQYTVTMPYNFPHVIISQVIDAYRAEGWANVCSKTWEDDQHQGTTFVTFTFTA